MLIHSSTLLTENGWRSVDALSKQTYPEVYDEFGVLQSVAIERASFNKEPIYRVIVSGSYPRLFATEAQVLRLADDTAIKVGDLFNTVGKRLKLYIRWFDRYDIATAKEGREVMSSSLRSRDWTFPSYFWGWSYQRKISYIAGLVSVASSLVRTKEGGQQHGYLLFTLPAAAHKDLRAFLQSINITPLVSTHTVGSRTHEYTKLSSVEALKLFAEKVGFFSDEEKKLRFSWLMEHKMPVVKDVRYVLSQVAYRVELGKVQHHWLPVNGFICYDNNEEE